MGCCCGWVTWHGDIQALSGECGRYEGDSTVYLQAGRMPAIPTPGRVSYLLCAGALYRVVPCSVEWVDCLSLSCYVCKQQCTRGSSVHGMLGANSTMSSLASAMPPAAVVYYALCVRFCGAWLTVQAPTALFQRLCPLGIGLCIIAVLFLSFCYALLCLGSCWQAGFLLRMDVPSGPTSTQNMQHSAACATA
jgi:hypothetical protein